MRLRKGDRVELVIDIDELKKGMKGTYYPKNTLGSHKAGVMFDDNYSISIGRRIDGVYIRIVENISKSIIKIKKS
jgi:hypothetical protein